MEIRFTASIITAFHMVLELAEGKLRIVPKGTKYDPENPKIPEEAYQQVEKPNWSDFDFFSRIQATPIREVKRARVSRGLETVTLERDVKFYHHGIPVATTHLIGHDLYRDGRSQEPDNAACWAIDRLRYAMTEDLNDRDDRSPDEWIPTASNWQAIDIEVVYVKGRYVEKQGNSIRRIEPTGNPAIDKQILNLDGKHRCNQCDNPTDRWEMFCCYCGAQNPHFTLRELKQAEGYDTIEQARAEECPDWHKLGDDETAKLVEHQKFCPFCGVDILALQAKSA